MTESINPKRARGIRKPQPHFVPPVAILEEAAVMAGGAAKYGPYNWQDQAVDASTYYDAMLRHLFAWLTGEDVDPESGRSHLAHVRASAGILLDAQATGQLIDDRPRAASAAEAMTRLAMHGGTTIDTPTL